MGCAKVEVCVVLGFGEMRQRESSEVRSAIGMALSMEKRRALQGKVGLEAADFGILFVP